MRDMQIERALLSLRVAKSLTGVAKNHSNNVALVNENMLLYLQAAHTRPSYSAICKYALQ